MNKIFLLIIFLLTGILNSEQFYKNLFSISEYEKNITNIDEIIKIVPQNSYFYEDNYLIELKILYENGEYEKLIKKVENEKRAFSKIIIQDLVNYLIALSYSKINKYNEAIKYLEKIKYDNYLKNGGGAIFNFSKNNLAEAEEYIKKFKTLNYNERYIELYITIYFLDLIISYKNNDYINSIKKYNDYKKYFYYDENLIINSFKIFYQSCLKLKNTNELIKECNELIRLLKFDALKYFEANILIKLLNYDKAEERIKELIEKAQRENNLEFLNILLYRLAEINFLKGRYNECINTLNKIKKEDENLQNVKNGLYGYTYYKMKKPQLAISYFDKITGSIKDNYYYQKYLIDKILIYFEENQYKEVIKSFAKLLEEKIDKELLIKNIYYYFHSLNRMNKSEEIIEFYKKHKKENYDDLAIYEISLAFTNKGEYKEAINLLKLLFTKVKDEKFREIINEAIGDNYFLSKDYKNSLKYYERIDEKNYGVIIKKINIFYITGQNNVCQKLINRYITEIKDELLLSKLKAYQYLILIKLKKYQEAEKILNDLLEIKYESEFFYNLFYLYYIENKLEEFTDKFFLYKKLLGKDKNNYLRILKLYTELLIKNQKYKEAINYLEELKNNNVEDNYKLSINIANCYKELKLYNKAKEILETILNNKELNEEQIEEVNYNLAVINLLKNDIYKSYEYLKKIKKYYIAEKYLTMGDINFNTKNYKIAKQFYEKIINEYNEAKIIDLAFYRNIMLNIIEKRYKEAERDMLLFINNYKSSEHYEKIIILLSNYYYTIKNFDEALKYINILLKQKSYQDDLDILNILKDIYYQKMDFKNSLKVCDILLTKVDEFYKPVILIDKGKLLILNGEISKSIEIFNELLRIDHLNKETYNYYLANNYLIIGENKKAEEYYKQLEKKGELKYKLLEEEIEYKINKKQIEIEYNENEFKELDYLEKIRYLYLIITKYKNVKDNKNVEKYKNEIKKIDKSKIYKIE